MRLLPSRGQGFRPDLEGIRGLMLLVILFAHLIEWPTGGFVALDLFFVLSGYLITGLLIREHERRQSIDIGRFYRRRIRRLAPAATLTVIVTVVVAFTLFPLTRAQDVLWDGVWALLLMANWNYAINGTDYFATWSPQSPLLHYWSLSVEEQFYLLWPVIIVGAAALGTMWSKRAASDVHRGSARSTSPYTAVVIAIAMISAASLVWSAIESSTNADVAYLSTLTRAWQLGAGALAYFADPLWRRIPGIARPVIAWSGLAVLLVTALTYSSALPYPGLWAVIPVAASLAIIVAGVGHDSKLVIATNTPTRYLGQISYSVYLWHWPIMLFMATVVGKDSPVYLWGGIPLSLIIGALAFHLVEDPVRRSNWLEPRRHRHRRRRDYGVKDQRRRRALAGAGAVASLVTAAGAIVVAVAVTGSPAVPAASIPKPATSAPTTSGEVAEEMVAAQVLAALDAPGWPEAVIEQIESGAYAEQSVVDAACLDVSAEIEQQCIVGEADLPLKAVVLGDSVALSWMPGLGPALNELGYRVHILSHSQCPFADVRASGSFQPGTVREGYPQECDDHRAWSLERSRELAPDVVIAADGEAEMQTLILPEGEDPRETWRSGLISSANALGGAPVVILSSPPQAPSIQECFTRIASVSDCTGRLAQQWRDQFGAAEEASAEAPLSVIDTRSWFCSGDGWCPPFAGDIVMRSDAQHLNAAYAQHLTAALVHAIGRTTS